MKKAKIIVSLGIIVIFLVSVITSILAYTYPTQDPINTVSGYCITIISFIVSVFSLIIAMITFFSIDALNSVTSMDNNVLENSDYTIAYSEMFAKFHDCKTQEEFGEKLIEEIDFPKRRTKTCMQYADWLQRIVDHLIWFAYIDFADEKLRGRREAIIIKVEKECKRYNSLSNGIQYLLNENVKLIKYVFQYQQAHDFSGNYICNLEDIRGKLLLNPVSQIIYFDYLGLYYRKEASRYLKIIGSNDKEFSAEYMKQVMTYSYTEEQRKLVRVFLNKALENFEKAYQCVNTDELVHTARSSSACFPVFQCTLSAA